MGQLALTITSGNFLNEVLESELPVLVDFWAPWCGPCRQISQLIDQLAHEYSGRVKVGKVDVDTNADIANEYGVLSLPTLLIFRGGVVIERFVGIPMKAKLIQALEEV